MCTNSFGRRAEVIKCLIDNTVVCGFFIESWSSSFAERQWDEMEFFRYLLCLGGIFCGSQFLSLGSALVLLFSFYG
jgi:hypothetical protein